MALIDSRYARRRAHRGLKLRNHRRITLEVLEPRRLLTGPQVESLVPAANSHTAPLDTDVSVIYDQALDPGSVSDATLAVHAMQSGRLLEPADAFAVSGNTITVDPAADFKPGELIRVTSTTGIENLGGEGSPAARTWQFRTEVTAGSGVFRDSGQDLGEAITFTVELGDLDGDGDLDVFAGKFGSANAVWFNDGNGYLVDSGQDIAGLEVAALALGDLDGDGDLDAFVGDGFDQSRPNQVWLNDGQGHFDDSGQRLGSSATANVALGDLDGDGDLDAFVVNGNWSTGMPNTVWLNDGQGHFDDSGQRLGNFHTQDVALGDLDGDGDLDAVVTNDYRRQEPSKLWLNDGQGGFTDVGGQTLGSLLSMSVALGDLDGDGDLDVFIANSDDPNTVWLNNGQARFIDSGQRLGGQASSFAVEFGDLDGDGDLDAFIGNTWSNQVFLNDGQGHFHDSGQWLGDTGTEDVAFGDLDGDGDLDAVVATFFDPGFDGKVWMNQVASPLLDPEPLQTVGTDNTVSWSAVPNADAYFVELDDDPAFASPDDQSGWITGTSHTFSNLAAGETYYYRAKSRESTPGDPGSWTQTTQVEWQTDMLADTVATAEGDVVLGPRPSIDTVGSTETEFVGENRGRLNAYLATHDATLTQIEFFLDVPESTPIEFVVFQGDSNFGGEYQRLHSMVLADSGTGPGFRASGSIAVPLQAGRHYMIGAAWQGSVTYYWGDGADVVFGTHVGTVGVGAYPAPELPGRPAPRTTAYYLRLTSTQGMPFVDNGSVTSAPITPEPLGRWDTLNFHATVEANTLLSVEVLPATGSTPIPGYEDVPGGVDLGGIVEPSVRLRANLATTDPGVTPALHDWTIGWNAPGDLIESSWSDVESSTQMAGVVGRYVFYNGSSFDGNDPDPNREDDRAIATDKRALLPGETAGFANYTSYDRGINGIMIDIAGLSDVPNTADFQFRVGNSDDPQGWDDAPEPARVTWRPSQGAGISDRVTILWDDYAICRQWLQVTVLPTAVTGLDEADVFYFGNSIAETGNSAVDARVNAVDALLTRNNPRTFLTPAPIYFDYDHNRDARVNATDLLLARNNQTHALSALELIRVPDPGTAANAVRPGERDGAREAPWVYEIEPTGSNRRLAAESDPFQEAVEALLATERP